MNNIPPHPATTRNGLLWLVHSLYLWSDQRNNVATCDEISNRVLKKNVVTLINNINFFVYDSTKQVSTNLYQRDLITTRFPPTYIQRHLVEIWGVRAELDPLPSLKHMLTLIKIVFLQILTYESILLPAGQTGPAEHNDMFLRYTMGI